jgi:hypothetical protein
MGWDVVIIARPSAAGAGYTGLKEAVWQLLTSAHLLETTASEGLAGRP